MSSWVYKSLKLFLRQITGNYFRNIHVDHVENMPLSGPTILCCNHSNQFMDAMILISQCPRPLSFCFAASSFNKPIVGYLAKKINSISIIFYFLKIFFKYIFHIFTPFAMNLYSFSIINKI